MATRYVRNTTIIIHIYYFTDTFFRLFLYITLAMHSWDERVKCALNTDDVIENIIKGRRVTTSSIDACDFAYDTMCHQCYNDARRVTLSLILFTLDINNKCPYYLEHLENKEIIDLCARFFDDINNCRRSEYAPPVSFYKFYCDLLRILPNEGHEDLRIIAPLTALYMTRRYINKDVEFLAQPFGEEEFVYPINYYYRGIREENIGFINYAAECNCKEACEYLAVVAPSFDYAPSIAVRFMDDGTDVVCKMCDRPYGDRFSKWYVDSCEGLVCCPNCEFSWRPPAAIWRHVISFVNESDEDECD